MKSIAADKTWRSLTEGERRRLEKIVDDNLNSEAMLITDKLLKMACQAIVEAQIGDKENSDEVNCIFFLAAFERIFKEARISNSRGTQDKDLDAKMKKIFVRNGYPDYFFRAMFENWNIETKGGTEK